MDCRKPSRKPTAALILTIALSLTSCRSSRTTVTATTERSEARTETSVGVSRTTDSVVVHDSVYVLVTQERTEVTRWRTQWRERTVHDTVVVHTTDTVRENVVREIENSPLPPSERGMGWIVAAVLFLLMLVYILITTFLKQH